MICRADAKSHFRDAEAASQKSPANEGSSAYLALAHPGPRGRVPLSPHAFSMNLRGCTVPAQWARSGDTPVSGILTGVRCEGVAFIEFRGFWLICKVGEYSSKCIYSLPIPSEDRRSCRQRRRWSHVTFGQELGGNLNDEKKDKLM